MAEGRERLWYNVNKLRNSIFRTCQTYLFVSAVIRECFSTSILLGSIDNPVTARTECSLEKVESEAISACICTTDLCNDLDSDTGHPVRHSTTVSTFAQEPRHERTFSPGRDNQFQFTTEASTVIPVPSRNSKTQSRGVLCYQCGSLFSRGGNSGCTEFDDTDSSQQGFCQQDEVCLIYTWEKSR